MAVMWKSVFKFLCFVAVVASLTALPVVADPCQADETSAECVKYIREKAKQGDAESQYQLGRMYALGKGVEQNKSNEMRWLKAAAEQGHVHAQFKLGMNLLNVSSLLTEKKREKALRWVHNAAEKGVVQAQSTLGQRYYYGAGVEKDLYEARRWYEKAAENGHSWAQLQLADMLRKGEGGYKDVRGAARWYRETADQGNTQSQLNLGFMYSQGEGVVQNFNEAYIWFLIAKAGGQEAADKVLREISWDNVLTSVEIKIAGKDASKRFDEIEKRRNSKTK